MIVALLNEKRTLVFLIGFLIGVVYLDLKQICKCVCKKTGGGRGEERKKRNKLDRQGQKPARTRKRVGKKFEKRIARHFCMTVSMSVFLLYDLLLEERIYFYRLFFAKQRSAPSWFGQDTKLLATIAIICDIRTPEGVDSNQKRLFTTGCVFA